MNELIIEVGKYEYCLDAAAQRLQAASEIGKVKAVGLMEVPNAIDELVEERDALKEALKHCRETMRRHGITTRAFAAACGISPTQLSAWTADEPDGEPDIVCSR